jgi:hypothetical protein
VGSLKLGLWFWGMKDSCSESKLIANGGVIVPRLLCMRRFGAALEKYPCLTFYNMSVMEPHKKS